MGKRREPTETEKLAEQRQQIQAALEGGKTELDLRTQSMDVLREACAIKTLTKLTLRDLGPTIRTLPKEIGQLTNLENLHIDSNELSSLPDEIGALSKLQVFYAYHNKFSQLPESFGRLTELRKLVLWQNELKTLPKSVGNLKKVTEIELKWNKIASLPDEIAGLASVTDLDLCSNHLKELPADLSGMVKLRRLQLESNKFKEFPRGALTLPALVEIDLSENGLTALPDDIDRLSTLRELDLEENALKELPKKLYALPISSLKLNNNKLTGVPHELAGLRSLIEFEIDDNPIKDVPEELLGKSKGEIFAHLGLWKPKVVHGDLPLPPERKAVLDKYKVKIEKFLRESKRHGGDKALKVLALLKGDTNEVPASALDDQSDLSALVDVLAPYEEWTFVDRRALAFMTQDAWRYKNPGYDYFRGFDEKVFSWLKEQMADEPRGSTLFGDVAKEILAEGIPEPMLVEGALRQLHDSVLREDDKSPTSFGAFLLDVAPRYEKIFAAIDRDSVKEAVIGLLLRHRRDVFMKIGDKLLTIAPDEDGETHVPYEAIEQACQVEPARFEKLLLTAIEKTDCDPCRAESGRVLVKYYPQHRAKALELAKRALTLISERKNKEERYSFYWSEGERWSDGTANYIAWAFKTFGKDIEAEVRAFVRDTKVFDLDVAEVVAKTLGQQAIDMLAEGLKMTFDDDEIAPHFRRMFALLAPLDWSKYRELAWGLARSEHRQVRETACLALSRLDAKTIVPLAKKLLDAKKAHEREGGVLILSLVDDADAKKTLRALLDTERTDDARDIIVDAMYRKETSCDRAALDARVSSAKARGKLDKPIAKWLDEKKLPKLVYAKSKTPLDGDTLRFLFYRQTRRTEIEIDPEARGPLGLVDRSKAGDFAAKLLALVAKNGGASAKNRFALALVGALGDDEVVAPLEKLAIDDRNENAVRTLGLLGSMQAARTLDRVMKVYRVKYPNVREAAQEAFDSIAERLGMTPFELADTMIPDFGFDKTMKLGIAATKPELWATLSADQKIVLVDGAGAPVKPPKTLAPKPKAEIKKLGEDVREAAKQLGSNLEYYLIVRRRWEPRAFDAFFDHNPLAFSFARGFVWGCYVGGKLKTSFRIDADHERFDVAGKPASVPAGADAQIGMLHPLEVSADQRAAWLAALKAAGVAPAFAQLDRPTFAVMEDERARAKCFRFEDKELSSQTFKGRAERRGWRRGSVVDSGSVSAYRKVFPHDKVEVFIGTDGMNVQSYDHDEEVTLKDLFFVRPGSIVTGSYTYDEPCDEGDDRLIKLGDVPPIVFSEAIADMTAILKQKEAEA